MEKGIASDAERKVIAILKVLSESSQPLGSVTISRELEGHGIFMSERAVRYHLRITDEKGHTRPMGRDGRIVTPEGLEELHLALAPEQVGFIIQKLELLAFHTTFDSRRRTGKIPINTSLFPRDSFREAFAPMKEAFDAGLSVSSLVAVASEGERLGEVIVPSGKVGLATVCSAVVNGVLLKAGVPTESRFGGVLQIRNSQAWRFAAIINYAGTSLDPSEQYIRAAMTKVGQASRTGTGSILANFREVPGPAKAVVAETMANLREAGIDAVHVLGNVSEPVCQIGVGANRIGMVLRGGLNPVAAAVEAGVQVENVGESGVLDFEKLVPFGDI